MMQLDNNSALYQFQRAFAACIRNPEQEALPDGVPERRMRVYQELLFNNMEGVLRACYPVTGKLLGEKAWLALVRRYFREHDCCAPLFRDIPGEFLQWLADLSVDLWAAQQPFMWELMHYEWLELVVSIDPAEPQSSIMTAQDNLLELKSRVNPTARIALYHYPVHRIGPGFSAQVNDGNNYCYLVYRNSADTVCFMETNPLSAKLFEVLQQDMSSGKDALMQIAHEINHQHPQQLLDSGVEQLKSWHQQEVLWFSGGIS